MPKYCVTIYYEGSSNYVVEALSEDAARNAAESLYKDGMEPDIVGGEYEVIIDTLVEALPNTAIDKLLDEVLELSCRAEDAKDNIVSANTIEVKPSGT